jgi:hypothetical protein
MNDTSPDIEARVARMMAERTPTERLHMASSMFDTAKEIIRAGLLQENPSLNEAQLRARMFVRMHGDCFPHPEIENILKHIPDMQRDDDFDGPKTVK